MIGAADVDGRFVTGNTRLLVDDWLFAVGDRAKTSIDVKTLAKTFEFPASCALWLPSMPPMTAYTMDNVYLLAFEETAGQHSFALSKDGSNRFYGLNLNTERGNVDRVSFDESFGTGYLHHYSIESHSQPIGSPKYLSFSDCLLFCDPYVSLGFLEQSWNIIKSGPYYDVHLSITNNNRPTQYVAIPADVIMQYAGENNGRPYYYIRESKGDRVYTIYSDFFKGLVGEFRGLNDRPPSTGFFEQAWYFNKKD